MSGYPFLRKLPHSGESTEPLKGASGFLEALCRDRADIRQTFRVIRVLGFRVLGFRVEGFRVESIVQQSGLGHLLLQQETSYLMPLQKNPIMLCFPLRLRGLAFQSRELQAAWRNSQG